MDYMKPDIKMKKVWQITNLIALLVFLFLAIGIGLFSYFVIKDFFWIGLTLSGFLVLWRLLALLLYPAIEYRQWSYGVSAEKIEIIHGIFFIKRVLIPVFRVQHISIDQGPIARAFGLFTVKISLASGSFDIVGLRKEVAEEISENIKKSVYYNLGGNEN